MTAPADFALARALLDAIAADPEAVERLRALAGAGPTGPEPSASPWMTAKEAAEYLRCSASRVRKLTMLGDLPAHHDGGRVLYRRDDLDVFVANGGASTGR